MPRTLPNSPTTELVRGVALADDEQWFAEYSEATHRHRRYYYGEFGFTANVQRWHEEAEELRDDLRTNYPWLTDTEVYLVVVTTRDLHRRFAYVALERRAHWANGLGLVPKRGGVRG